MTYENIFSKLNLNINNGLYFFDEEYWRNGQIFSRQTEFVLIEKIKPYAFFVFNGEPQILFFNQIEEKQFESIWNFNKSAAVFDLTESRLSIYNGFKFLKENKSLAILTEAKSLEDKSLSDFDYFELVSGKTWEKYANELKKENRVDEKLLSNIKYLSADLKARFNLSNATANNLIGRIIFIRYLIDRNVLIQFKTFPHINIEILQKILSSVEETYQFFSYLKSKFNGNLFPITLSERKEVTNDVLTTIKSFLDETDLKSGQVSLFKFYDFSIIPVELISNVYEFFIGQKEQQEKGAYYTPSFLVDYILSDTIKKHFEYANDSTCKVLDPSCGSGIFLVQSLRLIIEQYQKINPNYENDIPAYKNQLKNLLKANIFGIDSDESAINVAVFSLYLTLLDYLTPPDIVDFQFPEILDSNLFCADFFDLNKSYNTIFKNIRFDFILGNPPWGEVKASVKLYEKYWKEREKSEGKEIKVSDKQIAEVFLIRVSDFSFGETAFVVTSKILYKVGSKNEYPKTFRNYFVSNFKIRKVFEISSVRQHIFDMSNDPAKAAAVVLFYSHQTDVEIIKANIVTHISLKPNRFFKLFKTFLIEKNDIKQLRQEYFMNKKYDWIWKTLVYGNMLDYYFIKRLKDDYRTIGEEISDESDFLISSGIKKEDGKKQKDVSDLKDYSFLETKLLKQMYVPEILPKFEEILSKWEQKYWVGFRPQKICDFENNTLLFKEGKNKDTYRSMSAFVSDCKLVFKDSITGITTKNESKVVILKAISGIFSSIISSYYAINLDSSCGIDRDRTKPNEHLSFPYANSEKLVNLVSEMEVLAKKTNTIYSSSNAEKEVKILQDEIDEEILRIFDLDEEERTLLDYAYNISIPLIKQKDFGKTMGQIKFKTAYLEEYAKIFIDSFNRTFHSEGSYFETEVLWSEHVIGMVFKVIPYKSAYKNQICWQQGEDVRTLLLNAVRLQFDEISDRLFIQKDIRGFEEDFFYIIKPNEHKLWHKAVAYNDLREIDYEIMTATREEEENECE